MKTKIILLSIVLVILTKSTYAAKLVFNQIINNVGSIDVPAPSTTPFITVLGTVPPNKVWKVVQANLTPTSIGSPGWGTQKWAINGFYSGFTWLKAGDIISVHCTNGLYPNGSQLNNYIMHYSFNVIEFDVVP